MVLEQDRWLIEQACLEGKIEVVVERKHLEIGFEKWRGVVWVPYCVPSLAYWLPPHEDGIQLRQMEQVDGVISSVVATDGASDETLYVDSDEEMKETMKGIEFAARQG